MKIQYICCFNHFFTKSNHASVAGKTKQNRILTEYASLAISDWIGIMDLKSVFTVLCHITFCGLNLKFKFLKSFMRETFKYQ